MDHSMSALEMSMDLASQKVDGLSTEYEKMAKAGLCHDNYHGPGRETCRNASSALATIGGGSREGDFGGYVFAQESMDGLDEDVWAPLPYMKNYSVAMVSLWGDNGAIEKFDSLTQQSILIMDAALLHYEMLEGDAERQMRVVDEKYSRLQAKELEKIDEAVASSAIGSSGPGTISERLLEIKAEKQLTEINIFDRAAAIYDAKGEDYIYLAMEGMEDALDEFSSLEMELAILEDDAIDVVEAQKDEAAELIASLESMMAAEPRGTALQQHLEKAKEKFGEGDEASTLGAKYEAYYDAAAEARSALSSGLDYEEEVAVDSTIAEIDALLQKAKADEIPVEAEEAELNLLKTQTGLPGRLEYLENIKDSIVANARMKYGHLDGMRADIMSRIMLAGENAADLITEMNEDEAGVEFRADGTLDYELSLGQLKKLKAAYLDIEGSLEAHLTEMVANSMAVSEFSFIEDVALDEPAKVTLDLLLSNRHEYSADNVAVK
ncbi:TPA: hypothetical protein EYP38_03990, partial [Candidatus Micrarchaeota archaeon]|nr:hypothetical protein [Candidatus Micrarchaeota archaeon]